MSILRLALWRTERFQSLLAMAQRGASAGLVLTLLWAAAGCASPPPPGPPVETDAAVYEGGKIYIGDMVKVVFPGSQTLNFSQVVRVDGKLDLGLQGELEVEGKTAQEVEDELLKLYGEDLILKEISVSVIAAQFPVFVSGAVKKPQKVMVNRSVTVLEAIMDADGFDESRANLRKVQVIRLENGKQRTFVIDVKKALKQAESEPFHLRPSDIVYVPERFVYF